MAGTFYTPWSIIVHEIGLDCQLFDQFFHYKSKSVTFFMISSVFLDASKIHTCEIDDAAFSTIVYPQYKGKAKPDVIVPAIL